MAYGILIRSGGGGISSEEVTAKKSDILVGKTALTADSNDEITEGTLCDDASLLSADQLSSGVIAYGKDGARIEGSMANMNGGTWTPNSSNQTISCAGKKMNSNIIIGGIPSNYVPTSSAYIYNWGWGNLVNKGVGGYYPSWASGAISSWKATTNLPTRNDSGRLHFSMAGTLSSPAGFVTLGSVDVTPFKYIKMKWYAYTLSSGSHYFYITFAGTDKKTKKFYDYVNYPGAVTNTSYSEKVYDISSVTGQCFVSVYITSGGSMTSMGLEYMRFTTS